jgi:hypothetical protein
MSNIINNKNCELFVTKLSYNKTSALRQRNLTNRIKNDDITINYIEGIVFDRWSKKNSFTLLLKLLEEFEKSDVEYGIICQDDFYPVDNFLSELNKTVELLPEDWECLHLCPGFCWGRRFRNKRQLGLFNPSRPERIVNFESHKSDRFFINCNPSEWYNAHIWLGGPVAMLLNRKTLKGFIEKYKDIKNFDHEDRILVRILNNKSFVCKQPQLGYEEQCEGTSFRSHNNKHIVIGTSDTNVKKIKLDKAYDKDTKIHLIHNYEDTFSYNINNDELIVERTDKNSGWDFELVGYF